MKNIRMNTHNNITVTDKLVELAHGVSQQGRLADLSDEQLDAIRRPDSIVGFITLLNAADPASQETIIAQLDVEYLVKQHILNHEQLGECLTLSPLLAKRLLENYSVIAVHIYHIKKLVVLVKIAPQYASALLAIPMLRGLVVDDNDLAEIINSAPGCAHNLLTDAMLRDACIGKIGSGNGTSFLHKVKRVPECAIILAEYLSAEIKGGGILSDLLFAAPQLCDVFLNNPRMCKLINEKSLVMIIDRTPSSADILLARSEMLNLITDIEQLAAVIKCAPHWCGRLLNNPALRKLIKKIADMALLMKAAPQYAETLCEDVTLLDLIHNGFDLILIIESAPQLATRLLNDLRLRALIQSWYQINRILIAAPQCVNPYLSVAQVTAFSEIHNAAPTKAGLFLQFLSAFMSENAENKILWSIDWQLASLTNVVFQSEEDLIKAAAQYNDLMMKLARAFRNSSIVTDNDKAEWVPFFVRAIPQCAEMWLTDSRITTLMDGDILLEAIIRSDSRYWDSLVTQIRSRRCFYSYKAMMKAINVVPTLAEVLVECYAIQKSIRDGDMLEKFLTLAPHCAHFLLRNQSMLAEILSYPTLFRIIKLAPQCAKELLKVDRLRARIREVKDLLDIIALVPECAENLLDDERLCKIIAENVSCMVKIVQVAPQCASKLFWKVEVLFTSQHLAAFLEADPEGFLQMVIETLSKPNAISDLTKGSEIATFLTKAPNTLALLYPFCYLLKKTTDIARVLCHVAIDDVWDTSAKLPAIHGNVLWPIGAQTLSNSLLNQLFVEFERINTPRSRLMQAYLLIHTGHELIDDESIQNFTKLKKYHHDALTLLESLYLSEPTLLSAVKFLLIQIEAMHVTHVTLLEDAQIKGNKALRTIMKHENARMQLHLAHVHFSCGTNTFSNFLESRISFGEAHALQIPLLRYGSFWQRFNSEYFAELQNDEQQTQQITMVAKR
ncbi:MAG: hypothetical protein M3R00_00015 [Pseudomonadota bacterium]|nr:hypothetical protein [Pseudomonadota bacterium]